MKKGFLLTPTREQDQAVLQPVEAEDCPVCLDELQPSTSLFLSCRHSICIECAQNLWALRRAAQNTTHLECPLCRTLREFFPGPEHCSGPWPVRFRAACDCA